MTVSEKYVGMVTQQHGELDGYSHPRRARMIVVKTSSMDPDHTYGDDQRLGLGGHSRELDFAHTDPLSSETFRKSTFEEFLNCRFPDCTCEVTPAQEARTLLMPP